MFQDSLLQKALEPFAAQRLGLVLEKQTVLQSLNPIFSILFTLLIERQMNLRILMKMNLGAEPETQ